MPEICRFFGIVIRMYVEAAVQHHRPHFHAYYRDQAVVVAIEPVEILGGEFPSRQRRLVEAWAEIRQPELREDWNRLQAGKAPFKIDPLR